MRKILYTIILYTLLATPQQTTAETGDGLIGKPAPDWGKLRWVNSDPLQLNNLTNKVLLIQWWTTVRPFCKGSFAALHELHQLFTQEDFLVIGMYHPKPSHYKTLDKIAKTVNQLGVKFPMAIDIEGKILQKYWLDAKMYNQPPTSFLIGRKRKIRYIHQGDGYHQGGGKSHQQCQQDYKELKAQINKLLQEPADTTTQLTVSEAHLGKLKPDTPFREDRIQQLFPNFDIVKDTSSTEGELFPIFRIRKNSQDILVINPTSDHQHIFSVEIKNKIVKNELGANLGSTYHEVYGNQLDTNCSPGVEEQSGKVICFALGSKRIMYVFAGKWHGPDGVLPPIEILRSWELSEIVWKP